MATDSSHPLPVLAFQQFIQHVYKAFLIASAITSSAKAARIMGLAPSLTKGYRRAANAAGLCTGVVLGEAMFLG